MLTNPILCPLRNGVQLTRTAFKSFQSQDIQTSTLFIDNNSQDNTQQFLATTDAYVIRNNPGKGVAASWNQGLEWWFDQLGAEYVLVVNNDVELRRDTYRHLLESGEDFVTGVGSLDRSVAKGYSEKLSNCGRRPHPDFSCFLIKKVVWRRVGRFDENFLGAFGEDWDYDCRLNAEGFWAGCIDLPFYHFGSATIKQEGEKGIKEISGFADRNRAYFKKKWGFAGGSEEYYRFLGKGEPKENCHEK